jgi:prolyl oligopeptidase
MNPRLAMACALLLFAAPAFGATSAKAKKPPAKSAAATSKDPYLWLENVTGQKALAWVKQQNAKSTQAITNSEMFKSMDARFLEILDSQAKIPFIEKVGDSYYNFWKDKDHERGVWRRTSLAEYRKEQPGWETVLDLDALGKAEKESWVWAGAISLPPDYTRCLISLSRGGADATVVREFDLTSKSFVKDGFVLPEAKSNIAWRDRDAIYVGTDFGPGTMTTSGYPNVVKEWKRGTPLTAARVVYEGKLDDVGTTGYRDLTPGFERDLVLRNMTFYTNELYLLRDGKPVKIEKPDDADASTFREWLLIRLRTDWTAGDKTWPAGALLATHLDDFLAGKRAFDVLFKPTERTSLDSCTRFS